jgi:GTPase SAR1 family protein
MTNSFTKTVPKIYSLLSIGQRGVGKTVFLIGSCIELYTNQYEESGQQLWFDCEDAEAQQTLENILRQVVQTGQYPSATMRITNFDFSLKLRSLWGTKTLCQFRWWDPPGESCQLYNPAFLMMVLNSDGYCAFIDASAITEGVDDPQALAQAFEPVKSIADLLYSNNLRHPFAIILTKCDLVRSNSSNWQSLEKSLQPLRDLLDKLDVNYQIFYSAIPIVTTNGVFNLKTSEAVTPILWLVSKLKNADNLNLNESTIHPVV